MIAYIPVRKNANDKYFMSLSETSLDMENCRHNVFDTNFWSANWAALNPVVRIAKVNIVEIEEYLY